MKILANLLLACVLTPAAAGAQTLQQALELYYQGEINESLEMLEQLHAANPGDNQLRVWLASNLREFVKDEQARELVDQALRDEPCNAHALVLLAELVDGPDPIQRDSARAHLQRAVECAPDDGNAWLAYWEAATVRRDHPAEERAQRRLAELRFIPEPSMEFGRWMLRSAPPNAVLFTANDRDWVPINIARTVEGLRPDVTVVLTHMLDYPWYLRRIAQATGYAVPPVAEGQPEDQIMFNDGGGTLQQITVDLWAKEWTEGRGPRPLVVAATGNIMTFRETVGARWDGPLYTLYPQAEEPADAPRMDPDAFAAHLPHLDFARLNGPKVHPTDRDEVHHLYDHPAEYVVRMLMEYGGTRAAQGRMDDARQALARLEELRALGVLDAGYARDVDRLRERIENGQ